MSYPSRMKSEQVLEIGGLCPVMPVLEVERAEDAVSLAQAPLAGGHRVLEVTLRTADALKAISETASIKGAVVGAGTLRTPEDVRAAK